MPAAKKADAGAESDLLRVQRSLDGRHKRFQLKRQITVRTVEPEVTAGLEIQGQVGQIRAIEGGRAIHTSTQVRGIDSLLRMIQLVIQQRLGRASQSLQLTVEAAAEGVDHQATEILGTAALQPIADLVVAELTGQIDKPRHTQPLQVGPAAEGSTQSSGGAEVHLTLRRLQVTLKLECPLRQAAAQACSDDIDAEGCGLIEAEAAAEAKRTDRQFPTAVKPAGDSLGPGLRGQDHLQTIEGETLGIPAVATVFSQSLEIKRSVVPLHLHAAGPSIGTEHGLQAAGVGSGLQGQGQVLTEGATHPTLPPLHQLQSTEARVRQFQRQIRPQLAQRPLKTPPGCDRSPQGHTGQVAEAIQSQRLQVQTGLKLYRLEAVGPQGQRQLAGTIQERAVEAIKHQQGRCRGPTPLQIPAFQERIAALLQLQLQRRGRQGPRRRQLPGDRPGLSEGRLQRRTALHSCGARLSSRLIRFRRG